VGFRKGDKIAVSFGVPGKLQKIAGYEVVKEPQAGTEIKKLIAHEFGNSWHAKRSAVYPGPLSAAIQTLIMLHEPKSQVAIFGGGQKQYHQAESDIAFLYRLAGNIPVWRDGNGVVHVEPLPTIEVNEVIEFTPSEEEGRCYIAAGVTPEGQVFEVKVGEGVPTRIQEVFHSPAEAREFLQKLYNLRKSGKLRCTGKPGLRAGCRVKVQGKEYLATKVTHEVSGESWIITAYLS